MINKQIDGSKDDEAFLPLATQHGVSLPSVVVDDSQQWETIETVIVNGQVSSIALKS